MTRLRWLGWCGCDSEVGDDGVTGADDNEVGGRGRRWARSGWHMREENDKTVEEGEVEHITMRFRR
jgi:hypothetical protein